MKVMIVDDEPDMRLIIGMVLRKSGGCQTVEIDDPLQVLDAVRQERPDLILMDVFMEGADGPEVLAQLLADPATSAIPLIFVTGRSDDAECARLKSLGARGVISKPIAPKTLMAQVRAILGE